MLPGREQLGADDARTRLPARRLSFQDDRVVVDLRILEAQHALLQHQPVVLDLPVCGKLVEERRIRLRKARGKW
jgi:hypothetical protein